MFCSKCGNELEEDAAFCTNCGEPVDPPGQGEESDADYGVSGQTASLGYDQGPSAGQAFRPAVPVAGGASASKKPSPKTVGLAAGGAVVAIALIAVGVAFATGAFSSEGGSSSEASQMSQEQLSQEDAAAKSGDSEQKDVSSQKAAAIEVKSDISQYSWEEIAAIASEIEGSAKNRNDAVKQAAKYNLIGSDGTLTGSGKTLHTAMGDVDVFIVDVYRDKGSSGKCAAFTFMASSVFANHAMNSSASNSGGWKSSEMRTWLNSTVLQSFPDAIRSSVVPVTKQTNNTGKTTSTSSVTETQDSVWLFSWVECLGPIAWNTGSDQSYIDAVDNKEGSQYTWFSQQGVKGEQGHAALDRSLEGSSEPTVWWMRSSAPNTSTSFGDMGPEIDNGGSASTAEGVVFGFCL